MRKYKATIQYTEGPLSMMAGKTYLATETYTTCKTRKEALKKANHSVLHTNARTSRRAELISLELVKEA